ADEWDLPGSQEQDKTTPELSDVRIVAKASTGNPQPQAAKTTRAAAAVSPVGRSENGLDAMNAAARSMQSDAPACNTCRHITIRRGTCYKCLNCGNSMGCS